MTLAFLKSALRTRTLKVRRGRGRRMTFRPPIDVKFGRGQGGSFEMTSRFRTIGMVGGCPHSQPAAWTGGGGFGDAGVGNLGLS